jgi:hypothetical protein
MAGVVDDVEEYDLSTWCNACLKAKVRQARFGQCYCSEFPEGHVHV